MSVDPMQSIRVASTLLARFRAILDAAGHNPTMSDFELLIGESQQIYPEIWRHLDDAARELRTRGRDVAQFDVYRGHELVQLGVTEVEVTTRVDFAMLMMGGSNRTVKSATFNLGGLNRASAGCKALMAAMPEIDWAEVARAEDREIAAAGSLTTRRWISTAKYVGLAAAVILVAVGIHRFATGVPEAPPPQGSARAPDAETEVSHAEAEVSRARNRRLDELRATYHSTCDRSVLPELLQLLRETARSPEAHVLETGVCTALPPSCDPVRDQIEARLADQFGFVPHGRQLDCEGVVIGRGQALAIVVTGHAAGAAPRSMRGVTSADGTRELVPFTASPAPTLVGVADLDGDSNDELVMIGKTSLIVTRVDGLVDIPGPALRTGCSANVNVERDFRAGRKGERKLIVITVDDPAPKKCPPPGRHFYGLKDNAIVEIE
jgi:hypothetical protein